ncbi:hypothetical protein DAPPUDRAFT_106864 [Daphnia pulex]|uniref:Uncharacterized protein n=1 Tax=Daphnia pulex TaxID=6669 RepID=E9GV77_DAPPU|nr:hypothetical protein DAPPUDRAFT_106864 [Daphnia pulex]|eukprot:EFX76659.1 hypothetical protein DAPPUDRAFT_106864 [Daphnia pulex]
MDVSVLPGYNCRQCKHVVDEDVTKQCSAIIDLIGKPILQGKSVIISVLVEKGISVLSKAAKRKKPSIAKWQKSDIDRFVKYMILRNYLCEDLAFGTQGTVYGVLKPGLKSLDVKVLFSWPSEISAGTSLSSSNSLPDPEPMTLVVIVLTTILKVPVSLSAAGKNANLKISHDN